MSLISTSDFVGKVEIAINEFNEPKLQSYIDRYEVLTLQELMGVELYDLYVIGIALMPTPNPIYVKLRDAFTSQLNNEILISKGLADMVKCIVYFYFVRDQESQQSTGGNVKTKSQNSVGIGQVASGLASRYNEGVDTYQDVQKYIYDNIETYPTFKGVHKGYSISI
jgi:hypothetical protein